MTVRIGRKCFNCQSIFGCKIKGGETNACVACMILSDCSVTCTGDTTGGACPSCIRVQAHLKLLGKEDT